MIVPGRASSACNKANSRAVSSDVSPAKQAWRVAGSRSSLPLLRRGVLGVVAFGALIALIALAYHLGANPVLTFWLAYILTRPLGASLGDLLSQSREYGGAGLGTIYTSLAFLAFIVVL